MKVATSSSTSAFGVIARTWAPLALNWLMMALEGPLLVSLLGRLPEPTENLAAFSVAFSIALIVEAPVMMLLSTSAALGSSQSSYEKLWRFASFLALPLSGLMGLIGIPAIFHGLNGVLWHLPKNLAEHVAGAVRLLIPWPAAIAYRRLWQGILIRSGQARLVAWGTVWRLIGMSLGAGAAYTLTKWPGVWIAATALSTGVVTEMVVVRLWSSPTLRRLPSKETTPLSYAKIFRFYFPLLLTSLLNVALTPLLTLLIAHGREPILSLAGYSPTTNTVFLFSCLSVAYQEVVIVLLGTRVGNQLVAFAHRIAIGSMAGLSILLLPQVHELWFGSLYELPAEVRHLTWKGILSMLPMPAVLVYLSYLKGRFIWAHQTRINLLSAVVEIISVAGLASTLLFVVQMTALPAALLGLVGARMITLGVLSLLPYEAGLRKED
ncbi:MAG: hypothetical protein NZ989_04410 [Bacteroidia bacterium]|nr:hypothetical protein [Bacteroidia bacterium]MDW8057122.1 hypothetical protein [Bacteroidia bacterium]